MFILKDLMIKVAPEADGPEGRRGGCGWCSACTNGCSDACTQGYTCDYYSYCEPCTLVGCTCSCSQHCSEGCSIPSCGQTCTPLNTKPGRGRRFAGGLSELKAALQEQLAAVEEQERLAEEAMKPRTVEEVEALEQKLNEALEELQAIKKQLADDSGE